MKKISLFSALIFVAGLLVLFVLSSPASPANAQPENPPGMESQGLVYEGLAGNDPDCKSGYRIEGRAGKPKLCTHGPEQTPKGFDVKKPVAPVVSNAGFRGLPTFAKGVRGGMVPAITPTGPTVLCDGDGSSGNRVQVLYAHSSDVPSRYTAYLASFKTWVAGMDAIFNNSAAQTGGSRHIRFVHDASCNPIIPEVTVSSLGAQYFWATINDLESMGYNRWDRKYIVFMDARVYCGIGTMSYDDSVGAGNYNNYGDTFGRIDAGCWSDVIPAHELMHQLGGVQLSAPHSSGDTHCFDGWDDMCRPTNGTPLVIDCSDIAQGSLMDCGHDDYYSTNPPKGSYLDTHWNSANSAFLILPSAKSYRR